jgi:hypothetical protein
VGIRPAGQPGTGDLRSPDLGTGEVGEAGKAASTGGVREMGRVAFVRATGRAGGRASRAGKFFLSPATLLGLGQGIAQAIPGHIGPSAYGYDMIPLELIVEKSLFFQ